MFSLLLLSLLTFIKSSSASTVAAAVFGSGNTGITGRIFWIQGNLHVSLDFSGVNWNDPLIPAQCNESISWHIHDSWSYGNADPADRLGGAACSAANTGGHFDPWFACGPATGAADCTVKGGCIPPSSIYGDTKGNEYFCNQAAWDIPLPYGCEVGDLSGKWGKFNVSNITTVELHVGSYWAARRLLLGCDKSGVTKYSLVMHCGAHSNRTFCAGITREEISQQQVDLEGDQTITMDFSSIGSNYDFKIEATKTGYVQTGTLGAGVGCSSWKPYLTAKWTDTSTFAKANDNCNTALLGGIWDPTHQCINGSSSAYCDGNHRCPSSTNTMVTYECSAADDYFSCAVGDIYGRNGAQATFTFTDVLSPPLYSIGNKGFLLVCETDESIKICAATDQTNGSTVTGSPIDGSDGNGNDGAGFRVATCLPLMFVTIFIAAIFA